MGSTVHTRGNAKGPGGWDAWPGPAQQSAALLHFSSPRMSVVKGSLTSRS